MLEMKRAKLFIKVAGRIAHMLRLDVAICATTKAIPDIYGFMDSEIANTLRDVTLGEIYEEFRKNSF